VGRVAVAATVGVNAAGAINWQAVLIRARTVRQTKMLIQDMADFISPPEGLIGTIILDQKG
jgi:hypothetical protein